MSSSSQPTPDGPRLLAIRGPLKGSVYPLPEGEFAAGRQAVNDLILDDHAVSRRHCLFTREGERCEVRDLESRNGTFVNGAPIAQQQIDHGDEIRVGGSVFLFFEKSERPAQPDQTENLTRELRVQDSLYLSSSQEHTILGPSARALHDLQMLLRVSTMLHSFRGLHDTKRAPAAEVLRKHLAALILDMVPAERGGVLIPGTQSPEFVANEGLISRIMDERIAVWSDNVDGQGTSALGAPVMVRDEVAAIVYVESGDPKRRIDEGHLQLVTALASMAAGAWENATILGWLQEENERLQTELKLEHDMVGVSSKMADLQRQMSKVAPSNSTVLILGESGTGKELIARALHKNSLRASGPFIAINCAALTDTLLESELFGHEKGAFTGALMQKKGKLEMAENGTVFLDEIGELSPLLQAKLLRVLQQREMERVGGTKAIKLDIRVLTATNRDLEDMSKKGTFRQDLFYRLNVVSLKAPPLRVRPEDILPLAEHFAKKYAAECGGRKITGFSQQARAYLQSYSWPGNVRELENAIERAVVLGSGDTILPEDLPEQLLEARPPEVSASQYEEAIEAAKRAVVLKAFDQANYEHETAAKILGLHPNYLHKLIRTMDLKTVLKRSGR